MTSATAAWAEATIAGLRALADARLGEAATHWLRAGDGLQDLPAGDPLLAACGANAGAGALLLARTGEAERLLDEAERAWRRTLADVDRLDVPVTGRSSSFHFRLAARHLETFATARRRRYRELAEAALAITRFNRLLARGARAGDESAARRCRMLKTVLSDRLGQTAPEVHLLSGADGGWIGAAPLAFYADKAADCGARAPSLEARLPEACGRLEAATALTVLLVADVLPRGLAFGPAGGGLPASNSAIRHS